MYYQPTLEIRGMARRFLEGSHEGYGKNWTDKNYLALLDRQVIGCGSIARRHSNGEISCYVHPGLPPPRIRKQNPGRLLRKGFSEMNLTEHLFFLPAFQPAGAGIPIPAWIYDHRQRCADAAQHYQENLFHFRLYPCLCLLKKRRDPIGSGAF